MGGALEGSKRLELDHLAKLCEINGGFADIGELGTNLFRFQTLKEGIPGGALVQEVVDLKDDDGIDGLVVMYFAHSCWSMAGGQRLRRKEEVGRALW